MQLEGKVAVITGGASGIGKGTALAMARRGTDVVIADVNDRRLEETRAEIAVLGSRVLTVHCDVSKEADVQHLAQVARMEMGQVDILMNNAGVVLRGALSKSRWRTGSGRSGSTSSASFMASACLPAADDRPWQRLYH